MNVIREAVMQGDWWTALGGLSLLGLTLVVWGAVMRKTAVPRRWLALCLAGMLAGAAGTVAFAPHPDEVVIVKEGAVLLMSPFAGAETKAMTVSGARARLERAHGDFVYLRTGAGEGGWVERGAVSRPMWPWFRAG
jgi:hypothetical protein